MTRKAGRTRITALAIALACAYFTGGAPRPGAAQSVASYCISDIDASKWPDVQLKLRAIDTSGRFVSGLTTAAIFEGDQAATNVKLAAQDGPLHYAILVDGGRAPSRQTKTLMQRAIGLLASNDAFREGDFALVRVLKNESTKQPSSETNDVLPWTTDKASLRKFSELDFIPTNKTKTKPIDALDTLVRDLSDRNGSLIQTPAVVLLLTNQIEASNGDPELDARVISERLRKEGLSTYVLQTSAIGASSVKALLNTPDRYLQLTTKTDGLLELLLADASTQRRFYQVTYTSQYSGVGQRPVTLDTPANAPSCAISNVYEASPGQPQIVFDNLPGAVTFGPEKSLQTVNVKVVWPSDTPRPLKEANLLIDGQRRSKGELFDGGRAIKFVIRDSDVVGKSSAQLQVELIENNDRNITSQPRRIRLESGVVAPVVETPVTAASGSPAGSTSIVTLLLGVVAAAMVAIVALVGFLIFRNSNKSRGTAKAPTLQEQVMASVTVVEGPHGRKGEKIQLTKSKYVIGRQGADIVFYADAPRSTISRVHCTITRDADMSFWITDNVSSNGTRVNSKLVSPNERHPLLNGDQVQLGDADRNGVLLQFSLDHPTQYVRARG